MTEFEKQLIRHLIAGFEAAPRVPEPVPSAASNGRTAAKALDRSLAASPDRPDPGVVPWPEELALYLVLHATRSEDGPDWPDDPATVPIPAVRLRDSVYFAGEGWRIGVLRGVKPV